VGAGDTQGTIDESAALERIEVVLRTFGVQFSALGHAARQIA